VIKQHLKLDSKAFDEKLHAFLLKRFGHSADSLKEWRAATDAANKAAKAKDWPAAISEATKAIAAYPQYAGEGSAYEVLAAALIEKGDKIAARDALRGYAKNAGRKPEPLKKLAELEEVSGDKQAAAVALQRIIYIAPVGDEDLHKRLGGYYLDLKQPQRALPAFLAQLASKPVDPAGVYYNLARTYLALSRRPEAQDALFQALEVAPGFKPAQKLLLEMESK
jgi:cellulose synthase operon protein C